MGRKKRETIEFRFYEVPQDESALALLGEKKWRQKYGEGITNQHFHNLMEIGYCHEGKGVLVLDGEEHPYETGCFSVIPANYPHTTYSDHECFWEYLFFDPAELLSEMRPDNPVLQRSLLGQINRSALLFHSGEQEDLAGTVMRTLDEFREKRPFYQDATNHILKFILLELLRLGEEDSLRLIGGKQTLLFQITPALRYIDEHYATEIRASDLARACGLSETHTRRLFTEYVKLSPMDYVNLVRIQKACEILRKTDHSMDLVATECGFPSTSTFNRNFKKFLNTSPYQWKKGMDNYEYKLRNYRVLPLQGW